MLRKITYIESRDLYRLGLSRIAKSQGLQFESFCEPPEFIPEDNVVVCNASFALPLIARGLRVAVFSDAPERFLSLMFMKRGAWSYLQTNVEREKIIDALRSWSLGLRYLSEYIESKALARTSLTVKEVALLQGISRGLDFEGLCTELQCSKATVATHKANIQNKFQISSLELPILIWYLKKYDLLF